MADFNTFSKHKTKILLKVKKIIDGKKEVYDLGNEIQIIKWQSQKSHRIKQ